MAVAFRIFPGRQLVKESCGFCKTERSAIKNFVVNMFAFIESVFENVKIAV